MSQYNTDISRGLYLRIAKGDHIAFEHFYQSLKPKIAGYVLKLVKNESAAQEVIQESMIRFWLNREKLPDIQLPEAWLFKIIANECLRYLRRQHTTQQFLHKLEENSTDHSTGTEMELTYRDTQRVIQNIIEQLPERNREIYLLSRNEGLKMEEIAIKTGLSFQYVKKVLVATLKIIRETLIQQGRYIKILFFL